MTPILAPPVYRPSRRRSDELPVRLLVQAVTIGCTKAWRATKNRPAKIHPSATGSERSPPTVSGWSAKTVDRGGIHDGDADRGACATGANALAERLTVAFGARRISRLDDRPEVGVQVGRHSDRAVLRVLDAVDG